MAAPTTEELVELKVEINDLKTKAFDRLFLYVNGNKRPQDDGFRDLAQATESIVNATYDAVNRRMAEFDMAHG